MNSSIFAQTRRPRAAERFTVYFRQGSCSLWSSHYAALGHSQSANPSNLWSILAALSDSSVSPLCTEGGENETQMTQNETHCSCVVSNTIFIFLILEANEVLQVLAGSYPLFLVVGCSWLHVISFIQECRISRPCISLSFFMCLGDIKTAWNYCTYTMSTIQVLPCVILKMKQNFALRQSWNTVLYVHVFLEIWSHISNRAPESINICHMHIRVNKKQPTAHQCDISYSLSSLDVINGMR